LLYDAYKQLYSNYHLEKNDHEAAKAELATYQAKYLPTNAGYTNSSRNLRL
jgi:hypothetical protein